MFQYAAARSLALDKSAGLLLHVTNWKKRPGHPDHDRFALDLFGISAPRFRLAAYKMGRILRLNNRLGCIAPIRHVVDDTNIYNPKVHELRQTCWLRGSWVSHKYFEHNGATIRRELDLGQHLQASNLYGQVTPRTVSVHVRRGDYFWHPGEHRVLSGDYIRRAMAEFPDHQFLIFSDDIEWCRETFKDQDCLFSEGNSAIADMALMSSCPNNIIANSTFSWWAAWLNPNPDKRVIAPAKWFGADVADREKQEFIPSGWTRL
ncbi:MAG TPA: alpha-1,2-fucosyltransferase [Rhizomicrobium sp.]|nr:alpha-1,2-fucosyltransferase [Rhizomicrobium sp.]